MTNVLKSSTYVPILRTVETTTSPADALFGKARRIVLGLLFSHPDEPFYTRQVARILNMSAGALQRELVRLTAAGILLRETRGREVYYRANKESSIFADLQGLLLKTVGLADVLRVALATLEEQIAIAFIYGSLAKGTAKSNSDVDIMVIGEATSAEVIAALNPTQDTLRREVNPSVYPPDEVRSKVLAGHHFLTTVLLEPKLFLIGGENDLERLVKAGVVGEAPDQRPGDH